MIYESVLRIVIFNNRAQLRNKSLFPSTTIDYFSYKSIRENRLNPTKTRTESI